MAVLGDIVSFLSTTLELDRFEDSSLNGLQIEGAPSVSRVAVAVDAGQSVIEEAISQKAEFLLVHHGLFWGKPYALTGSYRRLFRTVLEADLSLYAVHLPLDAHPDYGNNFTLARLLELSKLEPACAYHGVKIGCKGKNHKKLSLQELTQPLLSLPGASEEGLSILPFGSDVPDTVAIVSGGGIDAVRDFEVDGFDTLVTGETCHWSYHYAKENNRLTVMCNSSHNRFKHRELPLVMRTQETLLQIPRHLTVSQLIEVQQKSNAHLIRYLSIQETLSELYSSCNYVEIAKLVSLTFVCKQ